MGVFVPHERFSLIWTRHHNPQRTADGTHMETSSGGFLACHTYCKTGHQVLMSSLRIRDTCTCCPAQQNATELSLSGHRLGSVATGAETEPRSHACEANALPHWTIDAIEINTFQLTNIHNLINLDLLSELVNYPDMISHIF